MAGKREKIYTKKIQLRREYDPCNLVIGLVGRLLKCCSRHPGSLLQRENEKHLNN